jgi:hypothetical protein
MTSNLQRSAESQGCRHAILDAPVDGGYQSAIAVIRSAILIVAKFEKVSDTA